MLEVFAGWVNDPSGALPDLPWISAIARALVVIASVGILFLLVWLVRRRPAANQYQVAYQQLAEQHRLLSESESRFRVLIETAAEGVWVVDRDGVTTFANAAMGEMLGCSETLVGRSLFDFIFAEEQVSVQARFELRLAGDCQRLEFRWRRVDGTPLHTLISTSVLLTPNGRISGLMGLITDISEIVALREQLQSLNLELGQRVELRTRELEESNRELAREIVVREYVQSELALSLIHI